MARFKREALSRANALRLVGAIKTQKERAVVMVLLHTGLRVSELSGLKRDDLDMDTGTLRVLGKGSKPRELVMSPEVKQLLTLHFQDGRRTFGIPIRTIRNITYRVTKRAGLAKPVSPHILRHTYAVETLRHGIPISALMQALGHSHLTTTAIYLEMSSEDAHEEFRRKQPWLQAAQSPGAASVESAAPVTPQTPKITQKPAKKGLK